MSKPPQGTKVGTVKVATIQLSVIAQNSYQCSLFAKILKMEHVASCPHFRTASGSEVDVILEKTDGLVSAIEIKASATVNASDFTALKLLRSQLGKRFRTGIVLYLWEKSVHFGNNLFLFPLPILWTR